MTFLMLAICATALVDGQLEDYSWANYQNALKNIQNCDETIPEAADIEEVLQYFMGLGDKFESGDLQVDSNFGYRAFCMLAKFYAQADRVIAHEKEVEANQNSQQESYDNVWGGQHSQENQPLNVAEGDYPAMEPDNFMEELQPADGSNANSSGDSLLAKYPDGYGYKLDNGDVEFHAPDGSIQLIPAAYLEGNSNVHIDIISRSSSQRRVRKNIASILHRMHAFRRNRVRSHSQTAGFRNIFQRGI